MNRPDRPLRSAERERDEDGAAHLRERSEGAHSEQIGDEANPREDPTPPGEEPDEQQREHGADEEDR